MGQARFAAAVARPRRATPRAQAAQRQSVRSAEEPSGSSAEPRQAGRAGSDRRDAQHDRGECRRARGNRLDSGAGKAAGGTAMTDRAWSERKPIEPWRQRLVRSLLYGRNVDRALKARARVGFVMLAFIAAYAVIGGRLVMFATGAFNQSAHRIAARERLATARPDIVDRNG